MRRTLMCLILVLLVAVPASAGADRAAIFADCTFFHDIPTPSANLDTLWFTTLQANAATGLSFDGLSVAELRAQTPPLAIPVGSDNNGVIQVLKRPVKKLLVRAEKPFTYRAFSNGITPQAIFVTVDTVSTSLSVIADAVGLIYGDKYPCWEVISYPDSVYLDAAASDSLHCVVGY